MLCSFLAFLASVISCLCESVPLARNFMGTQSGTNLSTSSKIGDINTSPEPCNATSLISLSIFFSRSFSNSNSDRRFHHLSGNCCARMTQQRLQLPFNSIHFQYRHEVLKKNYAQHTIKNQKQPTAIPINLVVLPC